jgi:hypothetical protein
VDVGELRVDEVALDVGFEADGVELTELEALENVVCEVVVWLIELDVVELTKLDELETVV